MVQEIEKVLSSLDGICRHLANKYKDPVSFDDLYQEARLSICNHFGGYNTSKKVKLSTYLFWYMRGDILKFIERKSSDTKKPLKELVDLPRIPWIQDYFEPITWDIYREIDLSFLKPKEEYVIVKYYYEQYTLRDITKEAGFTQSYWVKIKEAALEKLRRKLI